MYPTVRAGANPPVKRGSAQVDTKPWSGGGVRGAASGCVVRSFMTTRFEFADAWWFRGPLRTLTIAVIVFTLLSLAPALTDGTNPDHARALFGIGVLSAFVLGAVLFWVAISDSYVEVSRDAIAVRFESFFNVRIPVEDIVDVRPLDPQPRYRFRWGIATNFRDRISCSHGGRMLAITMSEPVTVRLWPRTLFVTRFWLAVPDDRALLSAIQHAREGLTPAERTLTRAA